MQKRIVDAVQYTELINKHLAATGSTENYWRICCSPVAGLGVFANKAIDVNDVIFEDHAVLSGPKAKQFLATYPCCVCYDLLDGNNMEILCRAGCCLPVCKNCSASPVHSEECKLLCSWKPRYINSTSVQMMHVVNILPIIRALWLNREQRHLLDGMQANCDKFYKAELQRASDSFDNFPQMNSRLVHYLERTICLFNTNAFEGSRLVGDYKVATKALFPLAGIMNHHCLPNAGHYFKDDGSMVVFATRPIAEGEEIFTMYTRTLWDNLARNVFLKITKSFICECERCLDPTMVTIGELMRLIDLNLADLRAPQPNWIIDASKLSGRGIFAIRDIHAGEVIFTERALVVGPTARQTTAPHTCVCCHQLLPSRDFLCKRHCTLPVCGLCSDSIRHRAECDWFISWQPIDIRCDGGQQQLVNLMTLRILTAVRVFLLNAEQRALVNAMQINAHKGYRQEIIKAAQCFRNFPTTDRYFMNDLFRIVGVLNTNAFETPLYVGEQELSLRALFPLTAIMNHECTPNASHYFDSSNTVIVRAARFISKGTEITTTYTKILWSNLTRNIFLKLTKNFNCNCFRCNDNTENGTYLSALYCREAQCKGLVIPEHSKSLQPNWICIKCQTVFPHSKMARYQDFALNTINNRINTCSINEMMTFINEVCPRFCPSSNYILIEAKLNILWRMSRQQSNDQPYTEEQLKYRDQYRNEILEILKKLDAGDCTIRKLISDGIN